MVFEGVKVRRNEGREKKKTGIFLIELHIILKFSHFYHVLMICANISRKDKTQHLEMRMSTI